MKTEDISIKQCFVSRWKQNGRLLEIDYSQLEVIGCAIISKDPMMQRDILDGVDSHSQSASWLNPEYSYEEILCKYKANVPMFVRMRKNAKAPRFELQYGAGASSIARNNNISIEAARGFIDRYYSRYSVLKKFQDDLMQYLKDNIKPSERRTPNGTPLGVAQWQSPTGRIYSFYEQESPEWASTRTSLSPTQIKNYPIQGFATGDIVPMMLGVIMRYLLSHTELRDNMLMINTIHDSLLFDINIDVVSYNHIRDVVKLLETVPIQLKRYFNFDIDNILPFKVECEIGSNWYDMKPLHL